MADINVLKEKVQKATEKVEKCKGTIARHEKARDKKMQAVLKEFGIDLTGKSKEEIEEIREPYRTTESSWVFYEVISKIKDIVGANSKLRVAQEILENWESKLNVEIEKERFLEGNAPQIIKDFLERWKKMAYDWHIKRYDDYQVFKVKIDKESKEAKIKVGVPEGHFPSRTQEELLKEMKLDYRSVEARKANFAGQSVLKMDTIRNEEERLVWLEKDLEAEKKAKMLDLINRINAVVGTITDAQYLSVSPEGNLNGYITGEKGKAKIETIGAGGYNIQCFHYRTLIHKL